MANGPGSSENWGTRAGVILAVTGSAVGLGNFLRFPGLAAEWGGAFMIPYVLAFLLLGLPVVWVEWSAGRWGGRQGYNSIIGIFFAMSKSRLAPYLGTIGMLIPVMIYMFYVYVASWCLGYAWMYATGQMRGVDNYATFALDYIGYTQDNGWVFMNPFESPLIFLVITFVLNFILIYRGVTRGIELFCKYAMPVLAVIALIMLGRVLTLSPPEDAPERTVLAGLGYMWNPDFAALANPMIWLQAAGQVFFSLSIGFAIIITYASYMRKDDDVALSGLTAASGNGFTEVVLAGLTIIPVGFMFMGDAISERLGSSFQLGFMALPNVFDQMPGGQFFGFLFFFLLFLAAVTSTLSMLQPPIAFLEEGLGVGRKAAVTLLGFVTVIGCGFVVYFMSGAVAMDTIEFWAVDMAIPLLALVILLMYGWVLGVDKGFDELRRGAEIPVPGFVMVLIKYVSPTFLVAIFAGLVYTSLLADRPADADPTPFEVLVDNPVAQLSFGLILAVLVLFVLLTGQAVARWRKRELAQTEVSP
ncbi:sodium-dependent transporter [Phycisphaerales bacterium AB-hyl4]|uniref:Sodium-dependent transporter n=1 Tax=Natronomicrosphaera hydrolytica TaxID=3242702 RepID=A0ABV4U9I9_9BACT